MDIYETQGQMIQVHNLKKNIYLSGELRDKVNELRYWGGVGWGIKYWWWQPQQACSGGLWVRMVATKEESRQVMGVKVKVVNIYVAETFLISCILFIYSFVLRFLFYLSIYSFYTLFTLLICLSASS